MTAPYMLTDAQKATDMLMTTCFHALQNWQGAQSIPRDITYDAELNELLFYPIVEIDQLRGQLLYNGSVTFGMVRLRKTQCSSH